MGAKQLENPSVRVNLSVPHALNQTLQRLATLQGTSKSGIVLEFLQEIEPALNQISDALEETKRTKQIPIEMLNTFVGDVLEKVGEMGAEMKNLKKVVETVKKCPDTLEMDLKPE